MYDGYVVVAIVVTNLYIVEEVAKFIKVDYEVLLYNVNVMDVMKDDVFIMLFEVCMSGVFEKFDKEINVVSQLCFVWGDTVVGFVVVDVVVEREFDMVMVY